MSLQGIDIGKYRQSNLRFRRRFCAKLVLSSPFTVTPPGNFNTLGVKTLIKAEGVEVQNPRDLMLFGNWGHSSSMAAHRLSVAQCKQICGS